MRTRCCVRFTRLVALGMLVTLLSVPALVWAAPSPIYTRFGTAIVLQDSAPGTHTLNLAGLTNAAGSYSARVDTGSAPYSATLHPIDYAWSCTFRLNAAGTVGNAVEVYVASSDGTATAGGNTYITGTTASALGALTNTNAKLNFSFLGAVTVDTTDNTKTHTVFGETRIPSEYFYVMIWNASGVTLHTTANQNTCTFRPLFLEAQ